MKKPKVKTPAAAPPPVNPEASVPRLQIALPGRTSGYTGVRALQIRRPGAGGLGGL